ncbi:hypothetical protein Drose_12300 [Dactylosporangium roseum]|uniref:Uncharacterized protein n=1 Tax=Dactylosporangium roseum TaxID=47989 RepID=A0ABY5ZA04_9ACTN|nr:hypothetical protein [Dactylosporangium roseum]UWZ38931.1 hypothetical protein Drose_12300 [Dactylosporangium roseum]
MSKTADSKTAHVFDQDGEPVVAMSAAAKAADRDPDDYGPEEFGSEADVNPATGTEYGEVDNWRAHER